MKNVLVIGGSRGIGAAVVRSFAKNGDRVFFTCVRNTAQAEALSRETGAEWHLCDAGNEEAVRRLFASLPCKRVDTLVYNAGVSYSGLLQDMTADEWDALFHTNVRGAFLNTRSVLPGMLEAHSGSIVYVSSMWGQVGASCEAAYSASKAALIGLAKAMAKELGPSGIRVNCVAPGVIQTDMLREYSPDDLAALRDETPLERLGTPQDIADACLYLCSDAARFVTGQVLGVNGGFVI